MSSDSEDDFLSADDGSDAELESNSYINLEEEQNRAAPLDYSVEDNCSNESTEGAEGCLDYNAEGNCSNECTEGAEGCLTTEGSAEGGRSLYTKEVTHSENRNVVYAEGCRSLDRDGLGTYENEEKKFSRSEEDVIIVKECLNAGVMAQNVEIQELDDGNESLVTEEIEDFKPKYRKSLPDRIESLVLTQNNTCENKGQNTRTDSDTKTELQLVESQSDRHILFASESCDFNTKPRKTSKMGLKKPREKLGERLTARKLGTRIGKSLDALSCDSVIPEAQARREDQNQSTDKVNTPETTPSTVLSTTSCEATDDNGWASWGGWGNTLISAASTLTQEVGRGVGSVVEIVEQGLGVPSAEELAREQREQERMRVLALQENWHMNWHETGLLPAPEKDDSSTDGSKSISSKGSSGASVSTGSPDTPAEEQVTESTSTQGSSFFGFGGISSLVSGVSGALEHASSKVVMGGLDTLELIGKRTMDVLQDTDPHLRARKDRILERVNKPNLSAVLREARERAVANTAVGSSASDDLPSPTSFEQRSHITFAGLWDNCAGPAHFEALALIARQCSASSRQLQASLPPHIRDIAEIASKEIMMLSVIDEESLSEGEVFIERVTATINQLNLPLDADKIAQCWSDLSNLSTLYSESNVNLPALQPLDGPTVQGKVMGSCVLLVEQIVAVAHKAAELCLAAQHDVRPQQLAEQYRGVVLLGARQLESCADAVCTGLASTPQRDQLTPTITNIYIEVCEGNSQLQQSLVHLCTILQQVQLQQFVE